MPCLLAALFERLAVFCALTRLLHISPHACGGAGPRVGGDSRCAARFALLLPALLLPLLLAGCARQSDPVLVVSAAANLQPALEAMQPDLAQAAGLPVVFNFGATGKLAQQLEQGAPVDVFLAANTDYVGELEDLGMLAPDSATVFARGRLVMLPGEDMTLARLDDLTRPTIKRIAIANPDHAPYGVAARQALQAAGLWQQLQPKLIFGENTMQSHQYVSAGNADVAILPLSLVIGDGTATWTPIAETLYSPLLQTAAIIKTSQHPDAAARFVQALTSAEAQATFRRYGYASPPKDTP